MYSWVPLTAPLQQTTSIFIVTATLLGIRQQYQWLRHRIDQCRNEGTGQCLRKCMRRRQLLGSRVSNYGRRSRCMHYQFVPSIWCRRVPLFDLIYHRIATWVECFAEYVKKMRVSLISWLLERRIMLHLSALNHKYHKYTALSVKV